MSGRIQNGFTDEIPEACTRDPDELAPPTPDTSTELSAERLAEIREIMFHWARDDHPMALLSREIMASYDALTTKMAALEREIEGDNRDWAHHVNMAFVDPGANPPVSWRSRALSAEAELAAARAPVSGLEILRLREWLMAPLFEGEDAPPEHMQAAQVITRLSRERGEARASAEQLAECADNFWAYIKGEHGVKLSAAEFDDHNVSGFFAAIATIRALKEKAHDADLKSVKGE